MLGDVLVLGLLLSALTYAGMAFSKQVGGFATIWPANGMLLAILLKSQSIRWPAYLLVGLITNMIAVMLVGFPIEYWLQLPLVNIAEVALSVALLRRYVGTSYDLSVPQVLWRFALIAALLAPLLSASLDALLFSFLSTAKVNETRFIAVFFAHALGVVTITPLMLSARRNELSLLFTRQQMATTLVAFGLLIGLTSIVFIQTRYPLLFLVFPPLVLVVCLLGLAGGALGLLVVTLISIAFTFNGHGSLVLIPHSSNLERLIILQLYAAAAAILVLVLAAALAERDRVKKQLETAKDELAQLAATDGLTGLANRRRLDEVLSLEYRRARRIQGAMSVLLLDIDRFKAFNDRYGHQAGDDCLRQISTIIAKFGRRPGDLAARYGGEELIVLLSQTNASFAEKTAEAIRAAIEALALPHAGNPGCGGIVTASIGVATVETSILPMDANALIAKADEMLYEAKQSGRNRVVSWSTKSTLAMPPQDETPLSAT